MTPEIKQKWIELLRSGEIEQCRNYYVLDWDKSKKPQYCALGVLNYLVQDQTDKDCEQQLTEDESLKILGLNDISKLSFPQIADWIEKNIQ